jgi:hypothetical protein
MMWRKDEKSALWQKQNEEITSIFVEIQEDRNHNTFTWTRLSYIAWGGLFMICVTTYVLLANGHFWF